MNNNGRHQLQADVAAAVKGGLFHEVDKRAVARLAKDGDMLAVRRGQRLITEGEPLRHLYLLCAGRLKLTKTDRDGRQLLLLVQGPGAVIGIPSLYAGGECLSNADMIEAGRVLKFTPALFRDLLDEQRGLNLRVLESLSYLLKESWGRIFSSGTKFGREQIAELIVKMSQTAVHDPLGFRVNRTELADTTGMAKETISRLLKHLAKARLIAIHGRKVRILNARGMAQMAGANH